MDCSRRVFMFAIKQSNIRPVLGFLLAMLIQLPSTSKTVMSNVNDVQKRLEHGDIVVDLKDVGATKYVEGKILINQPPDKVWPILVNPFEFQGKISPRMKTVEVMSDQTNRSVLKVTLDVVVIPHFTYTVESSYRNGESVEFHRIGGTLKDFKGSWVMSPADGGTKTELIYCMYIDPGFPVPQWIIREAVKCELPKTLTALRERVQTVSDHPSYKEKRTILAALIKFPYHRTNSNVPEAVNHNHTVAHADIAINPTIGLAGQ